MFAPLPAFWSEYRDPEGRTYYSNHRTKETTWEVSGRKEHQRGEQLEASPWFFPSEEVDRDREDTRKQAPSLRNFAEFYTTSDRASTIKKIIGGGWGGG